MAKKTFICIEGPLAGQQLEDPQTDYMRFSRSTDTFNNTYPSGIWTKEYADGNFPSGVLIHRSVFAELLAGLATQE
jgi:hypothetical protein